MTNDNGNSILLIHMPAFCVPSARLFPPLGLLYIGAALRQAGFGVRLFDFQDRHTTWEEVEDCVRTSRAPLAGFTCNSDNIHRVLRLSERILSLSAEARVVLGGSHVTCTGEPYVSGRRMVVRGEGELPMTRLADHFLRGCGSLSDIPGLMFEADGRIVSNAVHRVAAPDIDALPFPDYSLLPSLEDCEPVMTTSRGCPYRCHFCSEGTSQRGYRPRSAENIERELVALGEMFGGHLPCLYFADDTFTASPRRVLELCDMFDRVFPDKRNFGFFCEGRVNILGKHPELVFRLREAGMIRMQIGIEAGDQPTLDRINKRVRLEDIEKVIDACTRADLPSVHGAFICGLPGQTEADVMNEMEYAKHLIDVSDGRMETTMAPLSALPGTEFRVNAAQWGLRLLDADFVSGALLDGCFSETATLSKADITRLCRLFNTTLDAYILEKCSWFPPERIKSHFALAADRHLNTWLLRKFICHLHMDALLDLRTRWGHRFLDELPAEQVLDSAPLRLRQNLQTSSNSHWIVNASSPFRFEIDAHENAFYEYFNGKLTFREIGRRVAGERGKAAAWGIEECLRVYRKCEDKMSSIAVV